MKKVTTQTQKLIESIDRANRHLLKSVNLATREVLVEKIGNQSKNKSNATNYKKFVKQINQVEKHLNKIKSLIVIYDRVG